MQLQANEAYESYRMTMVMDDELRHPFLVAIRAYADSTTRNARARLVEAVIRTSRTLVDDDGLLPEDIRETLLGISERYNAFAPHMVGASPASYRDARVMIQGLFF